MGEVVKEQKLVDIRLKYARIKYLYLHTTQRWPYACVNLINSVFMVAVKQPDNIYLHSACVHAEYCVALRDLSFEPTSICANEARFWVKFQNTLEKSIVNAERIQKYIKNIR